ncbi:MAG: GWxTD domain-containing protein [Gemmatimonadaceae bacterium]|nr:GWxTD domain-containing protein [Gemmatimonadaceae bacterium]
MNSSRWLPLVFVVTTSLVPAATLHAQLPADTMGLAAWYRYASIADGVLKREDEQATIRSASPRASGSLFESGALRLVERDGLDRRDQMKDALARNYQFPDPPLGIVDLTLALNRFRHAVAMTPGSRRAWRHLFMAQAERNDWLSLAASAQQAGMVHPNFASTHLMLGLARTRQNDFTGASRAFADARRTMGDSAWRSFTSLSQLLQPRAYSVHQRFGDSVTFHAADRETQMQMERRFWTLADPRPSTPVNEAEVEYYARLAFADIRFSNDGPSMLGPRSMRGRIYVRYGPPDARYRMGSQYIWTYADGSVFMFGANASGNAQANEQRVVEDSILVHTPMSWGSMPLVRNTVRLPARVARFRAPGDSMDVIVAAALPTAALLANSDLGGKLPLDVRFDVTDTTGRTFGAETRTEQVDSERPPAAINATWHRRLPHGSHAIRLQAEQPDLERSSRIVLDAFRDSASGFGMSDILLGTGATHSQGPVPSRWRDVKVAPISEFIVANTPLSLVWESYDLVAGPDGVKFKTTIALERTFKHNVAGIAARIRANLRDLVMQDGSGTGSVEVSYDQSRPVASGSGATGGAVKSTVVADYVSINLEGQVPGPYKLRVTITDLVSGRSVSRSTPFTLVPTDTPPVVPKQ